MTPDEFIAFSEAATEFVAGYLTSDFQDVPVVPSVEPGYLHHLLPEHLPDKAEHWQDIMRDFKMKIFPGLTHWQSPHFHAFYPAQTSFPAIVGELLSAGLGVLGFNWICSPACTELEIIVMDWLAKFIHLPSKFLSQEGPGGGVIQGSVSEAMLIAIITAREMAIEKMVKQGADEDTMRCKLVMYTSDQANSCAEKNAKLAGIKCRLIKTRKDCILTGRMLEKALRADIKAGNVPCICVATMGTTETCDFDDVASVAEVCKRYGILSYVDAAYAGAAFCLPEYSHHSQALEHVDFFNFNPHKLMNVNYDCSAFWCADAQALMKAFNIERVYLSDGPAQANKWAPDLRHWEFALGRRFRALKVWITLRALGADNIRSGIRNRCNLAKHFNKLLDTDTRIEVVHKARVGLLTFALKAGNEATETLCNHLNEHKKIYVTPTELFGKFIIRISINGFEPCEKDIDLSFREIQKQIDKIEAKRCHKL